jgi:hypothetical protein
MGETFLEMCLPSQIVGCPQFVFAPVIVGCLALAFATLRLSVGALLPLGP